MPNSHQLPWRDAVRRLSIAAVSGLWVAALAASPAAAADKKPVQSVVPAAKAPVAASAPDASPGGESSQQTGQTPLSPQGGNDPMVASIEGHQIYLSDLGRAEQALPPNIRNLPFETLYPVLLNRVVDHQALVMLALRRDLEDRPDVKAQIQEATNRVLEAALLAMDAAPKVTEAAIKARYDQEYANRPATEQVRASHILVSTKAAADKIIAELKHGADFTTLAEKYSIDPDGKRGGDLGYFSREQVWPGFADVAFSLEPGQVADEPVHNEFGWHVVKVEERRLVPPPSLKDVQAAIRDELTKEAISHEVAFARSQFDIHEWNLNGSEINPAMAVGSVADRQK